MKKRILSLSIAAMIGGVGFVGGASAAVFTSGANTVATTSTLTANAKGTGNILLVPYFSTQNGNATLLNIVNTDTLNGKAVKVRFRGASNSDDIFDFQVYMSPGDVWTASVSQNASGISTLTTNDKTCTLPAALSGTAFQTGRVQSTLTSAQIANQTREGYIEILNMADIPKGGFPDQATVAAGVLTVPTVNPLYTAVKHVNGVPPCTAATLNLLATDPTNFATYASVGAAANAVSATSTVPVTTSATGLGLSYPTGGLTADWTIINVTNTTTYTGKATALVPSSAANLVFFPQTSSTLTSTPYGYAGTVTVSGTGAVTVNTVDTASTVLLDSVTADPLLRTSSLEYNAGTFVAALAAAPNAAFTPNGNSAISGALNQAAAGSTAYIANPVVAAAYYDQPDLSTPYVGGVDQTVVSTTGAAPTGSKATLNQAYYLTSALATAGVTNEFLTNPVIAASTDWVFSMPTRRYHTAYAYAYGGAAGNGQVYTDYANSTPGVANPFFNNVNTSVSNSATSGYQICTAVGASVSAFGQEEQANAASSPTFVVSPGTPAPTATFKICGEASVLSFQGGTTAPASVLGASVAATIVSGLPTTDGWFGITTNTGAAGAPNVGLPVLGYSAEKAVNGATAAGVSGNFGLLFPHVTK